jgi:hypothetical protein
LRHRFRQLSSLYGPLGLALVKFPTIFPTQLSGESFLVEGDGAGCTHPPLVGGNLTLSAVLQRYPTPIEILAKPTPPGGHPPNWLDGTWRSLYSRFCSIDRHSSCRRPLFYY